MDVDEVRASTAWKEQTRFRESIARTPIAAVAALLLTVGTMSASTASTKNGDVASLAMLATGTTTVSHYQDGHRRGTLSHIDDGDRFKVCDTEADGDGVGGFVIKTGYGGARIVHKVDDGGDAGCDYSTYDIKGGTTYIMRICWKGWGHGCTDKYLAE